MVTRRNALAGLAVILTAPALALRAQDAARGLPGTTPPATPDRVTTTATTTAKKSSGILEMSYSDASPRNRMDIYRPPGKGPFPALLDIHGGGFVTGDKRELRVPQQVLDRGIAVIRMNYRLSNQALWPAQQDDVLTAANFLQSRASDLGLVPGRLALGGRSAGAFMAVSAALTMQQEGHPPAAVVDFYGPMDFGRMDSDMARLGRKVKRLPVDDPKSVESLLVGYSVGTRRKDASAMGPVGRLDLLAQGVRLPPLMIRHGVQDSIVSVHQAEHLRDAWRRADPHARIDFALLGGEGHGTKAFGSDAVLGDLAKFLDRHLNAADG